MAEITKSYEPRDVEKKWYAAWLEAKAFASKVDPARPAYSIVIPPPNVTGVLTMGHVLNNSIQDILIRRARLEGKSPVWVPGTDHAGIATQTVVERELRKQKKTRHDFGREKFLEKVWEWRHEKGGIILEQLRRLGASCDWDRTAFTMDPAYSKRVLHVFVELFNRGYIYRGKRMVNWCPVSLTALSDEEVIMKPVNGALYRVRYELVDQPGRFIEVKTTRPETIPGDVAIAVHPEDPRYADIIGKKVRRPIGPAAEIPIIADNAVDRAFGTGALKITPAHDKVDYEVGQRHKLPAIDVLQPNGVLNELAGSELAGMDRFVGRKRAAELLKERGALLEEEAYSNNVGYSERADVPIEPRLTEQWWLRYPKIEEAKAAVRDGHIKFHPERWSKVYLHWLENIQDWCISRQLWWGHRIPVWYRKGADRSDPKNWHVSVDGPADPQNWEQEDDVLDTWASSWLWPFATMGWPDQAEMKQAGFDYFYPTSTLVTGPDIIFFWVARMIMAGLEFVRPGESLERRIPFRDVYFTGIIRDQQGRKMSKSLGNSPDPLVLIDKYGADGLRFGIISIAPQGQDIRFQEDRIEGGKNFCNKLWNACRFRQMSGEAGDNASLAAIAARLEPAKFDADDHAILDRLSATTAELERCFREFEFSAAVQALYSFFWGDFCDWYVEVSKAKMQAAETKANCLAIQDVVLRQTLLLLHPFVPFITEELWGLLGYAGNESVDARKPGAFIQNARLETAAEFGAALQRAGLVLDRSQSTAVEGLKTFVSQARALKAEHNLASRRDVKLFVTATDAGWATLEANLAKLARMAGAAEITRRESVEGAPAIVTPLGTIYLDLASTVDVGAEKARLKKELDLIAKHIAGTEARLANQAFVSKAPPAVLEGAKKQLADQQAKRAELERLLKGLG
ncbi:valine--tRNA ligase [Opitutus terrae]|uniref:Valine--tRNA ligase n=1 Tax=Opitutus terrae (strain DSM 11246 / JCM 15787 / PB90-1) TaxID=452637 RepID=B1ZYQ3_OPITP|nr:valyl-tRNA synthetase [Opitutus terrae PB90-1]